jgi:hypothetical protein
VGDVSKRMKIVRLSRNLTIGVLSGTLLVLFLAIVSGATLTRPRLISVAQEALASGELPFNAHRDEDYFTECSMLTMQYLRNDNLVLNAIETRFVMSAAHPCEDLQALLTFGRLPGTPGSSPTSYVNYPFGSRYLEALILSALDFGSAKQLYALLSYGSVCVLFLGAWRNSPRQALILLPVGVFLLFGFGFHRFGHSLSHAPGFFVGFSALGAFLAGRDRFRQPDNRVIFFGCLGTIVAFFDLMHGSIPVVLSLTIVLNHLFYVAPAAQLDAGLSPGRYWFVAFREAVIVCVCFVVAYAALTVGRLLLLSLIIDGGWAQYAVALGFRLGNEVPGRAISLQDVIEKLWQARFQLTPGGFTPSTSMLVMSLAAWIFTIGVFPLVLWRRSRTSLAVLADVSVVVLAAVGVLAWFRLFRQHTFIHVLFAVRNAAVPASYGFLTAGLVVRSLSAAPWGALRWAVPACAALSLAVSAYLLEGTMSAITAARLVEQPVVDEVACAPVGLRRDGKPDGLIELSVTTTQVSPPLAAFGWRPRAFSPTYMRLERSSPPGWWETGSGSYVLGITRRPNSELLNLPDGSVLVPPQPRTLWAHFCRDGHDTADSRYTLHVGDRSLTVEGR